MTWLGLRGEFIEGSDAIQITGRNTSGLKGIRRIPPKANPLTIDDELVIAVTPEENGWLTLLVEIEPLQRFTCLVPNDHTDSRAIKTDYGFEYPSEVDPRIVLTEPEGLHRVFAAVSSSPLSEDLRAEIAARQGDCDRSLLNRIAAELTAMPDKELNCRDFRLQKEQG